MQNQSWVSVLEKCLCLNKWKNKRQEDFSVTGQYELLSNYLIIIINVLIQFSYYSPVYPFLRESKVPNFQLLFLMLELHFESPGGIFGGPKVFSSRNPTEFSAVGNFAVYTL